MRCLQGQKVNTCRTILFFFFFVFFSADSLLIKFLFKLFFSVYAFFNAVSSFFLCEIQVKMKLLCDLCARRAFSNFIRRYTVCSFIYLLILIYCVFIHYVFHISVLFLDSATSTILLYIRKILGSSHSTIFYQMSKLIINRPLKSIFLFCFLLFNFFSSCFHLFFFLYFLFLFFFLLIQL